MPDPAIFVIGAMVTLVTVMACRAVGRAEEQDARDQERRRRESTSEPDAPDDRFRNSES